MIRKENPSTATTGQPAFLWFALVLLAVYPTAILLADVLPRTPSPGALAAGLTVDLVGLVPFAWYLVFIRGRGWPAITLAPVFLASFGLASVLLPGEHQKLLSLLGYALPAVELTVVAYIGVKGWRIVRSNRAAGASGGDFHTSLRRTLRGAFDAPQVVAALAYELSLFHYAFSVRGKSSIPNTFSYHRRSGYGAVFAAILMAALFELTAVHLLLRSWSETAAWIHIGLSLYGMIWLTGDFRAMGRRPHELRANRISLRDGLRWDIELEPDRIDVVRRTRRPSAGDDYLNAVPLGDPHYVVELHGPTTANGPYGITREVRRIGIAVDDSSGFEARLQTLGIGVVSG